MKTEIDVLKIAELAKLSIEKEKLEDFEHDMKEIVAFAEILSEREDGFDVMPEEGDFSLREDAPEDEADGVKLISGAADTQDRYICVPKVLE